MTVAQRRVCLLFRRRAMVILATVLASTLAVKTARAEELSDVKIVGVRVGLDNQFKVGHWTPIEVTLQGDSQLREGQVHLILPDADGVPTRISSSPEQLLQLGPQPITVSLEAKFGQGASDLEVQFSTADGQMLAKRVFPSQLTPDENSIPVSLAATDELIVQVGGGDSGVAAAVQGTKHSGQLRIAQLDSPAQLPMRWIGYEAVDTLVLVTSDPKPFEKFIADSPQGRALNEWVRLGGRVLMYVGRSAPKVLQPEGALAAIAPGKFEKMLTLRRSAPIEAYSLATQRIITIGRRFRVNVPRLTNVEGNIEAFDGTQPENLPLVVRSKHGFGEVVTVLLDLDRSPFQSWPGRPQMLQRLLQRPTLRNDDESERARIATTLGYHELVGQLRSALDQFRGVTLVPFWIVASAIFAYLLWIGPIDYWLVKKVFKRAELTWITFPLAVVLVSAAASYSAVWLKGRQLITNQVELVDVDTRTGLVRGTTWTTLFSPRPDAYDLTIRPKLPGGVSPTKKPEVVMSWLGLAGRGLGGMNSQASNSPLFRHPYDFTPSLDELERVPIQVWSTKSVTSRWTAEGKFPIEAELAEHADQMLRGRLVNRLGIEVLDARLFYDRWVYALGVLPDGKELVINELLQPLHAKTMLTQQRVVGQKDMRSVYDSETTDVTRIMEMMMFHDAAGGAAYTSLVNDYQAFCDLSGHLKNGCAVLVLRVRDNGSALMRDDEVIHSDSDGRWTFYRFVLPVHRE